MIYIDDGNIESGCDNVFYLVNFWFGSNVGGVIVFFV